MILAWITFEPAPGYALVLQGGIGYSQYALPAKGNIGKASHCDRRKILILTEDELISKKYRGCKAEFGTLDLPGVARFPGPLNLLAATGFSNRPPIVRFVSEPQGP
jgi:hypothetical protein